MSNDVYAMEWSGFLNSSQERDIEELLTRPVGRPSHVQVSN